MDAQFPLRHPNFAAPCDLDIPARQDVPAPQPIFAAALAFLAARVMATIERARSRRMLATLDERALRDIGLDRGTAQYEYEKPFWRG